MLHTSSLVNVWILISIISIDNTLCSIDGTFTPRHRPETKISKLIHDLCHPLYWYPRHIPDFCIYRKKIEDRPCLTDDTSPIPMPIPIPAPAIPMPPPIQMPIPPAMPIPIPPSPIPYPLPFGIPLAPTYPMLPVSGVFNALPIAPPPVPHPPPSPPALPPIMPLPGYIPPYGIQRRPMSMVPGVPGLVAPDGGINILPFSDAYSDLLERHKQKMIRLRLQKLLDEYDGFGRESHEH